MENKYFAFFMNFYSFHIDKKHFIQLNIRRCSNTTNAQIAQLVEQRTENPRVTGSIPVLGIWDISSVGRALDF